MKIWETVADRFSIPAEASEGIPRITIVGNGRVLIENHRGILAYSPECIEVNGGRFKLKIRGEGLTLRAMDPEAIVINGTVFGVDTE